MYSAFLIRSVLELSLTFVTQIRGFKPGQSRRIFQGEKIHSTPSFGGEVKSLSCPMSQICGM
jgi:hypothetical protein